MKFDQPIKDLITTSLPGIDIQFGETQKKPFKQCILAPVDDTKEVEMFLIKNNIPYVKNYLPQQFNLVRFREV